MVGSFVECQFATSTSESDSPYSRLVTGGVSHSFAPQRLWLVAVPKADPKGSALAFQECLIKVFLCVSALFPLPVRPDLTTGPSVLRFRYL